VFFRPKSIVVATTYTIREDHVSHNKFDDEVIVVNLVSGSYFSLHESAAEIWELLRQGPGSAQSLANAFGGSNPAAASEIAAFLELLAAQSLIAAGDAAAQPTRTAAAYATPSLEAFDELRELLLADIVHDTDEAGWPHLAEAAKS
jgi:hypothetical protein